MVSDIFYWYLPSIILENIFFLLVSLLIIGFLGFHHNSAWKSIRPVVSNHLHIVNVIVIYIIFLISSSSTAFIQLIDYRFLSPILIPLNILFFSYLLEVLNHSRNQNNINVFSFFQIFFFISILIFYPLSISKNIIFDQISEGKSFTSKSWRENETMKYFTEKMTDCNVYSNGSSVILFYTGKEVRAVPKKRNGGIEIDTLTTLKKKWPYEDQVCLIWFDDIDYDLGLYVTFNPEDLLSITKLQKEIKFKDGTIYFLSKIIPN